jgi:hypothetical protein
MAEKSETLVEAKVAPGRTVMVGKRGEMKMAHAGTTVSLPESEVKRLRKLGFLVRADGAIPVAGGVGPKYLTGDAADAKEPGA